MKTNSADSREVDAERRNALMDRATERIEAGDLPAEFSGTTHAGDGSDGPCSLCGEKIEKSKIEYEIQWRKKDVPCVVRFHLECFQAWVCLSEATARPEC
jgi:hypothetical protein